MKEKERRRRWEERD